MSVAERVALDVIIASMDVVLRTLGLILDEEKWKPAADSMLNSLEEVFKEGSLADESIEYVTGRIRNKLSIMDSNPDN